MTWYKDEQNKSGIAFSSRIRLARNLCDVAFPDRLEAEAARRVVGDIRTALKDVIGDEKWHDLDLQSIDPLNRQALMERHLISPEMTHDRSAAILLIHDDERLGVLVNEEDHLRIQSLRPGLSLYAAYADAADLATRFEAKLPFAYSQRYGYLTSCPTNVGTGMRASVMLHLPALGRANLIPKLLQTLSRSGFTLRGYNGEGSQSDGDLYQISNQITLGRHETDILRDLSDITQQVITSEEQSRRAFYEADPVAVKNRVGRAYGILSHAASISRQEAMELLSALREGLELGIRDKPDMGVINAISLQIGSAGVQWQHGQAMDSSERDQARADLIKTMLKENKTND